MKSKIQRFLLIVLLIFSTTNLRAQEKLDSLYKVVGAMPDDTSKLSVYLYLCEFSYNIDSAGKYCNLMVDLAQKLDNQYYLAYAYSYLSRYYIWINDYEHAFWANTESIYLWEELENQSQLAMMYMNMGTILTMETDYSSATKYYQISLNSFRELADSTHITQVLQSLGFVNIIVNSFTIALNYYIEAHTIDSLIDNTYGLIADNVGIARIYLNKYKSRPCDSTSVKLLKTARKHFDIAYNLALTVPNVVEMQILHVSKATIYIEEAILTAGKERQNLLDSSEMHMQQLSELRNTYNITSNKIEMQIVLAQTEMLRGNYNKAQKHLTEAQTEIETNAPLTYLKRELYFAYQLYYQLIGDYKKTAEYAIKVQYLLMDYRNDELLSNIERTKMQTEFDERMRRRALDNYEREQQLKNHATRQRTIFSVVFATISAILIMLFISSFRRKKLNLLLSKKNLLLDERNLQLQSAKEELSVQNDMLNNINKSLTDSITYAKHIQEAAIPTTEQMNKIFGDCLIIFNPCNIVSGDFYWAVHIGRYKALAVADCTGHGVPGALMSMLGISMLNDIVANIDMKSTDVRACDILEIMRANVIKALRQDQSDAGGTFDGIDMALLLIDTERQQLQYAGAFRPLIMLRNDELTKFEPNRMPIGIYNKHNSFTNNVIDIQSGDTFYAYSDGITDQFGNGSNIEKFGRNRLYSLLLNNYNKSFSEQKQILLNAFDQWTHSNPKQPKSEQIDDMLLIGIRV